MNKLKKFIRNEGSKGMFDVGYRSPHHYGWDTEPRVTRIIQPAYRGTKDKTNCRRYSQGFCFRIPLTKQCAFWFWHRGPKTTAEDFEGLTIATAEDWS